MADQPLKARINDEMKLAMKARNKQRVGTLRLILAELKRIEVDERIDIDDARVLTVLDKMCKQRRDSLKQFQDAGRTELAEQEAFEITVIQEFQPEQLGQDELNQLITDAIAQSEAQSMKDMGKVMGLLKPKLQGRADMSEVSKLIKAKLA
jgi:uncharacterized protein